MMHRNRLRCPYVLIVFIALSSVATPDAEAAEKKNILMMAGKPSHRYGAHEHYAGLKILEEAINASSEQVDVKVVREWPNDDSLVEQADTIVIYCDGGGRHLAMNHRDRLKEKLAEGCGLVCIHYAVEMVPGQPGDDWVEMLGGHFEVNWSVNPHWVAEFETLPEHPISNGVKPFATDDEWYFHMRFSEQGKVTPILAAVAPEHTMSRKDGAHSGNPHVRKSVARGDAQVVAWAYDRKDGGRSFGFTGGHNHWNWGHDDMRRLVANAIRWTAGEDIEPNGSSLGKREVGVKELLENQDYDRPNNFDLDGTIKKFKLKGAAPAEPASNAKAPSNAKARRLHATGIVTAQTKGHREALEVSIKGVKDLFLVATDGGNGYACDWCTWVDPVISGPAGEKSLVDLGWKSASSDYGRVNKNANCSGKPCSIDGQVVNDKCIGAHANSVIRFEIPRGYNKLRVTGALDSGGTSQSGCGQDASVQFLVYADASPKIGRNAGATDGSQREPENAIAGLAVAPGLEATLSASEPQLRSLTNLDIDDRGRVWVCDVMNYRRNNGSRPEGDRILILEDTTGDGVMDKVKTFYQGRDIDSAMGICVLGNEVIVTASPYVWRFIDEDGDDKPDRKEAMFTETGMPQHDHSGHSFLFGPDGKLYWNVGNTGKQVKDKDGNTVVDIHGRAVVDNGKPFYGGMPFRCDLDGSNFEVLAHNFRNNWETTVDSFGTLWQSDNDDDGNRGTRINFVMEHGNYGYRDERTGAGWRDARINMEEEIPLRHWHLNDPGVIPNILQTGAGSPSGICMYEGRLLPKRFWDQVIHCDPGPNVVRAYPTKPDGAGYSASIDPLLTGTTDKWFRPADVCVAPDGSLFVTDWYDPGVGGHRQGDTDRGRLFRIAPPGTKYTVPKFDYSTVDGAIAALRNPNLAVRYKAWMALHKMGGQAEAALLELFQDSNPRIRARALWLLGKIERRGGHYVQLAIKDADPNIRITAIRLTRQIGLTPSVALAPLANDKSSAVRRELLVALRFDESPSMPKIWAQLAEAHDGKDRWYLEALGLASDLRAAECYDEWLAGGGRVETAAGSDIAWRVRAPKAAEAIVKLIAASSPSETPRYFRSLEYHDAETRTAALKKLVAFAAPTKSKEGDALVVRSIERMQGVDLAKEPEIAAALERHLKAVAGTSEYFQLLKRFRPAGMEDRLEEILVASDNDSMRVEAAAMLAETADGPKRIRTRLFGKNTQDAASVARVLGLLGNGRSVRMLSDVAGDAEQPFDVRSTAVSGLARNKAGEKSLLELASSKKLAADTRLLAGGLLARSRDEATRKRAAELLPLPKQKDQKPLAPLDQLAKMKGNVKHGLELFRTKATCANCHKVAGVGKEVGPDLSEIGSKLSREAMFTAILDPSAGISHNYENYQVLTDAGQMISGLKMSETNDEIVIRTAEAIDRKIPRDEVEGIKKSDKSIMPDNLHQLVDQQGLVDIIEYMVSLKKKG